MRRSHAALRLNSANEYGQNGRVRGEADAVAALLVLPE
ncbi:hypothetical protein ABIB82_005968 [Bradyrhizobium sp. i1.8.4]